ncbi:glycine/sarcosine/betaine reductase complex component C subunit beta [Acetohalobium arabaticum]|uniref:3-Oxoacyl-(Acyl-carrier-protein (ACP)) synthase III n=1 Tax=Acetohalobium arabaticum (strain ATCC 49924 / DSM 5501 / Z-7288) TaxID=574087 RepID=D9QPZ8_ACEAZ|nr:glycine/sarcosine/betaine reductase complex component C subunit beta [Acetohalobium arabaticum]ADL12589.1 3-Oxoacyl-(acyl-carrier-protein (ACP)) synthase III [Acetohalobium arabaticum DSM 5501]
MNEAVLKGNSYVLVHAANTLLEHGSTQTSERAQNPDSEYLKQAPEFLRSYEEVVGYGPNQSYIGNMSIKDLEDIERPWYENNVDDASRFSDWGEIMPEDEFYGVMKMADSFDLVQLSEDFAKDVKDKLADHSLLEDNLDQIEGTAVDSIQEMVDEHTAEPLYLDGELIGCVKQAHDTDVNLNAHTMLENTVVKASGILSMLHLGKQEGIDLAEIDYVIEVSEEACGDINQRGGGNFAKSIAEMAGCKQATGSDTRSFCAGPAHGLIHAAGLVKSGMFDNVVVVAGGSTAKLGMNGKDHVKNEMPILEDCLGGFAVLVSEDDGKSPVIRTDAVGRHTVDTGSSPQAVISSLVTEPLDNIDLGITDIDKYSVEMQNPDITEPAGAGNVPESNYKMIAALGVKRGDLEKKELPNFVDEHGMPGFAPTQGHIPSGVPFIGHARREMLAGEMERSMIIGKGSLFLGRMTNLFDGVSFIMEANEGQDSNETGVSEDEIKGIVAKAMRNLSDSLLADEE